jgi:hypothetical protein
MISKSKNNNPSKKVKEVTLNDFYQIFFQESELIEGEVDKKEKQILLDKLEKYTKGKNLVFENSLV